MLAVQVDVEKLEGLFTIIDKDRIMAFLNPELVVLLLEAYTEIRKYFPDDPLELKVEDDPEIENRTHLILLIVSDFEIEEAIQRNKMFVNNWWLANMNRADGRLLIDFE